MSCKPSSFSFSSASSSSLSSSSSSSSSAVGPDASRRIDDRDDDDGDEDNDFKQEWSEESLHSSEVLGNGQQHTSGKLRVASWNMGQAIQDKIDETLEFCGNHGLDVMGLQETGVVSGESAAARDAGYELLFSNLEHAGVAVLVHNSILPFKRAVLLPSSEALCGRAMAIRFEMGDLSFVIVCVYMPAGLDGCGVGDPSYEMAAAMYDQIEIWSGLCNGNVMVMGDFNETLSAQDRFQARVEDSAVSARSRPALVGRMQVMRFHDACDSMTADKRMTYQYGGEGGLCSSRLDHIFFKNGTVEQVIIYQRALSPHLTNRHYVLEAEWTLDRSVTRAAWKPSFVPIINIKNADEDTKLKFVANVDVWMEVHRRELVSCLGSCDGDTLDAVVANLSSMVLTSAADTIGWTKPHRPMHSARRAWLERWRWRLKRCMRALAALPMSSEVPDDLRAAACRVASRAEADPDAWMSGWCQSGNVGEVIVGLKTLLPGFNREIRHQKNDAKKNRQEKRFDSNPHAFVNSILRGDKPAGILSLVDPTSQKLVADPDGLKAILASHFARVFACDVKEEEHIATDPPKWFASLYAPKENILPSWYDGLLVPFTPDEVRRVCCKCEYGVAAGPDRVGAGLWRLLVENSACVCEVMAAYWNACVRLRKCPSAGKFSIIVPIPKKAHGDNTLDNVRPISLQNAIVKLLMKALASRLSDIFARHSILHPAQEAFLRGGAPWKCVDCCVDVWETARQHGRAWT